MLSRQASDDVSSLAACISVVLAVALGYTAMMMSPKIRVTTLPLLSINEEVASG